MLGSQARVVGQVNPSPDTPPNTPSNTSPVRPSGALPSLGDSSELAASSERRIGDRIVASLFRDPDYLEDAVLHDYLQSIWQPLMAAARASGDITPELDERFAWQVFLIRDRTVNAFALPGGYLGVHLGLIGAVSNRDELAAVLGHELSHVTQRHISRLISQQGKTAPWMIGAIILGALAASKNPQAASALVTSGQAIAMQNQLNFSRDMEREADRIGFSLMQNAGFDTRGVTSMFEKLSQASRFDDNGAFPYLRSHPLNTQRIAEVQARVQLPTAGKAGGAAVGAALTATTRTAQLALHAMMAARARVLAEPGVDALRAKLQEAERLSLALRLDAGGAAAVNGGDFNIGAFYGGALAAAKLREFGLAQTLADKVMSAAQTSPEVGRYAALLRTEIALLSNRSPAAFQTLDISKTTQRAELLLGARALLAAGRSQDVAGRLSTWVADHPKDAAAWQLLATAYGNQGQTVRAIRADAESQVALMDYQAALDRFKAAQLMMRGSPGAVDFMDGSIIDTRTRQIELLIREKTLQDKLDR